MRTRRAVIQSVVLMSASPLRLATTHISLGPGGQHVSVNGGHGAYASCSIHRLICVRQSGLCAAVNPVTARDSDCLCFTAVCRVPKQWVLPRPRTLVMTDRAFFPLQTTSSQRSSSDCRDFRQYGRGGDLRGQTWRKYFHLSLLFSMYDSRIPWRGS